jgi:hypothetical protein
VELVAHRARRLTTTSQHRIHLTALVEHPQHRELLRPQASLLVDEGVALSAQPLRRPRPQLVEMIGHVEHPMIKSRGCDTYRPNPAGNLE